MKLSILIPAYNEEKRLPKTLERVISFFKENKIDFEIIVVNDGSTDTTKEIIQLQNRKCEQIILVDYSENRGKGYAVNKGVQKATGDLILFSDADLSTPIEEYEKLKKHINKGYDVAIGSRRIKGAEIKIKQPLHRRIVGRGFGLLVEIFVLKGIKDTQCGFKLMRSGITKKAFKLQRVNGFCFDVEILMIFKKIFNARIKQVPVTWIDSPALSKLNVGKEFFRTFKDLIKIRLMY